MSLRFLIVDTNYPAFLQSVYADSRMEKDPYASQWRALMDRCFGTADFYSHNLRLLGHEATEVIVNCEPLQRRWAEENGLTLRDTGDRGKWLFQVLRAQIASYRPDVLYVQDMNWVNAAFLREERSQVKLIVGQTAYGLQPDADYGCFDLVLTSFPHYVGMFRNAGLHSEYLRLAFETRVLNHLGNVEAIYGPVFVGGYGASHRSGVQILEHVARRTAVDFWGYGIEDLPAGSPIRRTYHGQCWGLDMYRVLARSRIALNRHIQLAERFANNMRLFEATGVGTCLVTDDKENLHELFEPGKEVLVYRNAEECAELVRYYVEHETERLAIARAGQERTLHEHTYQQRMREMCEIVDRYVRQPRRQVQHAFIASPTMRRRYVAKAKAIARPLFASLPAPVRSRIRSFYGRFGGRSLPYQISAGHTVIPQSAVTPGLIEGWKNPIIPSRQRGLVRSELSRMYAGEAIPAYKIAAEAVRATGMAGASIVEVGCASGYYYEVLGHLLRQKIKYVGIDYSPALAAQARQFYPDVPFLVGDTTSLPLADNSCDILLSGGVLLHVPEYERAIKETARVSKYWCIFHRTPVVRTIPTTFFSKQAYGVHVVELVFNEEELLALFAKHGLTMVAELVVGSHGIESIGENGVIKTYVCRKSSYSQSKAG